MPNVLDNNTTSLIRSLIHQFSGYAEETAPFKALESHAFHSAQIADSLYFCNRTEIDPIIESISNKFTLHGLIAPAARIKQLYEKLVPTSLKREELVTRLNTVKFLLSVSQSPTNNFYKYVGTFQNYGKGDCDEIVDWTSYLLEGIPKWSIPSDDESDAWTNSSEEDVSEEIIVDQSANRNIQLVCKTHHEEQDILVLYRNSKSKLLKNVQSDWFNSDRIVMKPLSQEREANIAILWENFINEITLGLIPQSTSIITEYKVLREIVWQFYEPHTSSCFSLIGNDVVPAVNVTISSVRNRALQAILFDIVPYINWLEVLREFHDSIINSRNDPYVIVPETYRSYSFAVQSILKPVFDSLKLIEDNIKSQENPYTLLRAVNEIRQNFQCVKLLYNIHRKVTLDFRQHSTFQCARTLLWHLHNGLLYSSSKLEHDLYLTLYLHSLYKYLTIIDAWLSRDELDDQAEEFVISDRNPKELHAYFSKPCVTPNVQDFERETSRKTLEGEQDWHMDFIIKNSSFIQSDGLLEIICTQVWQIGKNIHLLRLLGKLHLLPEFTGRSNETFYKAFIRRVLESIKNFFNLEDYESPKQSNFDSNTYIFPAICPDGCKYFTERDKLENLVDTTDGFLMKAFESFFIKKPTECETLPEKTLFEKVTESSNGFFPAYEMVEDVFTTILKERYVISGIMVKNILINDYHLENQFSFLKHVYLFEDDLIFPVYRHIFNEIDKGTIWTNRVQLSSYLQDIIMDLYPKFFDKCIIEIKDLCKYTSDPLKISRLINIKYKIPWPVNIILRDEHILLYKELFQFILMIKWALFTLHHMYFSELEPKAHLRKQQPKVLQNLIVRLKILRFGLINTFSSIQHYVLGHIFNKHVVSFKKEFDEAYDLESLVAAHSNFIQSLSKECIALRDYESSKHGIYLLLYVVTELRNMWRNIGAIKQEDLNSCVNWYLLCQKTIDPILNPTSYNFVSKCYKFA